MANESMTMNDAIDTAVDLATTAGLGEPIVEDAPVEETPKGAHETETPAEKPKGEPEAEAAPEPSELAAQLAELTHTDVVQTKAGKGLVAELQRERQKRHELEAQLQALQTAKPKAEEFEPEPEEASEEDPLAALADDDLVEARHVKAIVAAEVAKAVKPVAERFTRTDRAERQQVMATGLAALAASQKAGEIPAGVNTSAIVNKAVETLKASRPALLQELLSEPDPVRAVWEYATARLPEAKQALAKATNAKAGITAERLAKGRSPDTGGETASITDLIADLNAP